MPSVVVTTALAKGTGQSMQQHLIYGVNTALWWMFAYTSTQTLSSYSSSDLVTWTARNTLTLTKVHNSEGRNLGVSYKNISSTDVVHIANDYQVSATDHEVWEVRATLSERLAPLGLRPRSTPRRPSALRERMSAPWSSSTPTIRSGKTPVAKRWWCKHG